MAYNKEAFVKAGTLEKMFRRYTQLVTNPSAVKPHYNAETGRYDNLGDWLALQLDGLVYGVQEPLYDYSPVTTAIKTDANAGLVLEASSESSAGRNDYADKALFFCKRVNGGVDTDGQPYVTAIEGEDDRFDPTQNTYALTPVYYERHTLVGTNYVLHQYSDSPQNGFTECVGAYQKGQKVPFILRACYMDSAGDFSSKSGTMPATLHGSPTEVGHCGNYDFNNSRSRSADGLTYLSYGDVTYWWSFMQLMLGVKAPRSVAVGCVSYNYQYQVAAAEEGVSRVLLTDAQAANILVGSTLSIGTRSANNSDRNQATMHDVAKGCKVLSKVAQGDGTTAINLDIAEIDVAETYWVSTMPWYNGTCDGVLGTFGARTADALTNGKEPFRFQNIELEMGCYEVVANMYSNAAVADGVATHTWYVAPNVSDTTGLNKGSGWTALAQQTAGATGNWRYVKDYAHEQGAMVPSAVAGTSTTGWCSAWYPSAGAGDRETLVGGALDNGAHAGVGCVPSPYTLSRAYWYFGGRSSAIGHAAQAA